MRKAAAREGRIAGIMRLVTDLSARVRASLRLKSDLPIHYNDRLSAPDRCTLPTGPFFPKIGANQRWFSEVAYGETICVFFRGWKGRWNRNDDQPEEPGPPRIHHHHRGVQFVLREQEKIPSRNVGSGAFQPEEGGKGDGREVRGRENPSPPFRPLRIEIFHARDDGHGSEPGTQRHDPYGPCRKNRQ